MANLKPIKDPESKDPNAKTHEIPKNMKLRKMILKEKKFDGKTQPINVKTEGPKVANLEVIGDKDRRIDCMKVAQLVLEGIESMDSNKAFCIGKGPKRIFCGQVIHKVPIGGYARIGGGECIVSQRSPVEGGNFKYDRDNQLAVSIPNNIGKDFVVVVSANGCVFVDSSAHLSFHMPVFVVEPTGDYYKVSSGKRIINLGPGGHIIIYTVEAPILFVKEGAKTKDKTVISSSVKDTPKEKSSSKDKSKESSIDKTSSKTASKTDSKTESKIDSKTDSKTASKTGSKPESKEKSKSMSQSKEEPKSEITEEPKVVSKEEPKQEETAPKVEPIIEPKPKENLKELEKTVENAANTGVKELEKSGKEQKQELKKEEKSSAPVITGQSDQTETTAGSPKWKKLVTIVLPILVVLFIVFLIFGRSKKEEENGSQTEQNG